MRLGLVAALVAVLAASAGAAVIPATPPDLQSAVVTASPGDTIVLSPGVYDSVYHFNTSYGIRTAICRLPSGVTLRGAIRKDCVLDHAAAEYGILLTGSTSSAVRNLTVRGGIGRDRGRMIDGDGRDLVGGIACLYDSSPTIGNVTISESATGIIVREGCAPVISNTVIARGSHHGVYAFDNGPTAAVLDHVTIVDSFDAGVYAYAASVEISSSSITHSGKAGVYAYECTPEIAYCNVYMNGQTSADPLNYDGAIGDQTGLSGNVSTEPYYCDYFGSAGYDYHVCFSSPNVGAGAGGTDIGAYGGACSACVSPVTPATWGAIKALYR